MSVNDAMHRYRFNDKIADADRYDLGDIVYAKYLIFYNYINRK